VLQLVGHIWSIPLRRLERLAALPATALESIPADPLDAFFDVHCEAVEVFRRLLARFVDSWNEPLRLTGSHPSGG
jgi:hypothetical protein